MGNRLALAPLALLAACSVAPPAASPAPPPTPPAEAPSSVAGVAPSAEPPEAVARAFVDGVAHRRFEAATARFDAEMQEAMSPAALEELWRTIEDAAGAFQAVEGAETDVEADYRVVRVICRDGAEAAVDLALHTRELDPRRVVVAGHSQGGYLAPRIAAESAGVAAIVLLAGPSRPLQDSLLDQLTYLLKLEPGNVEKKRLVEAARVFKARVEDPALRPDASVDLPGGAAEEGQYFLALRGYRPTEVAARLSIPMLVLQGDRDYQVTAPDFDGWRRALGGRPGVELKQYAGLNHLFITGTGAPRPGEYETPGHVDAAVIGDVAAFVGRLPAGP